MTDVDNGGAGTGATPPTDAANATPPAGQPNPAVPKEPETPPGNWYDGIENEGLRGMIQLKNWKDAGEMARSYQQLEQRFGQAQGNPDRVVVLPEEQNAETMADVYNKLGRPTDASGYELPATDILPSDDPMVGQFRNKAHELGLSKAQAEAMYNWYAEQSGELVQQQATQTTEKAEADIAALQKEWGATYDERVELAKRAAKALGVTGAQLDAEEDANGTRWLFEHYYNIGKNMKEDGLTGVQDGKTTFGLTPEAAKQRIAELKKDKAWMAKYLAGGANEKAEFQKLTRFATA